MANILYVLTGGAIGSLLRYFVVVNFNKSHNSIPWGTFSVNLIGSLLIGISWGILNLKTSDAQWKVFVFTGLLGGFTTFSSFALEGYSLLQDGKIWVALFYVAASNIIGLLLVYFGVQLVKFTASM